MGLLDRYKQDIKNNYIYAIDLINLLHKTNGYKEIGNYLYLVNKDNPIKSYKINEYNEIVLFDSEVFIPKLIEILFSKNIITTNENFNERMKGSEFVLSDYEIK